MNPLLLVIAMLTQDDVSDAVRQNVSCLDCEIKILSIHIPPNKNIEEFESIELISRDSKSFGRKVFTAYFKQGGKNFIGTVFAYVDKKVMTLVAQKRLSRGDKVNLEDFEVKEMYLTTLPQDYISPSDLKGEEILKVPLAKGEILRKTHLEQEYSIRKGDKIKIVRNSRKIYLEFPGLALQDAKYGEQVKVRNLSSNKIIYGTAKEGKIVEIND